MNKVPTKVTTKKPTSDVATMATQKSNRKEITTMETVSQDLIDTRLKQLQNLYNCTQDSLKSVNEKQNKEYKVKFAKMEIIKQTYDNLPNNDAKAEALNTILKMEKLLRLVRENWDIYYNSTTKDLHFSELQPRENFKTKKEYTDYLKQEAENIKTQEEMYLRNLDKIKEQSQKILEQQEQASKRTKKKGKGTE